jgi:hypothetical protein
MTIRLIAALTLACLVSAPAAAQQRPLATEDPETVKSPIKM